MRVLIVSEPSEYGVFYFVDELIRYLLKQRVWVDFAYSSVRSGPELQRLINLRQRAWRRNPGSKGHKRAAVERRSRFPSLARLCSKATT